jgi:hypothetical protein
MCNTLDTEELPPYLMPVVAPIYRTVNDEQNKAAGFGNTYYKRLYLLLIILNTIYI